VENEGLPPNHDIIVGRNSPEEVVEVRASKIWWTVGSQRAERSKPSLSKRLTLSDKVILFPQSRVEDAMVEVEHDELLARSRSVLQKKKRTEVSEAGRGYETALTMMSRLKVSMVSLSLRLV